MNEVFQSIVKKEKFLTTSYNKAKYNSKARYIHKYYLPNDLKQRIFLADIIAVMFEFDDVAVVDVVLPENIPCCNVHYSDIYADKIISSIDVGLMLQAIVAYYADCQCELTEDENRAAVNLNAWLAEWEKKLLSECIRFSEEMEQRVQSGDSWLTDYEIDLEVEFYIRDDDPYSEGNNPDSNEYDVDSDAALLCTTLLVGCGPIFAKDITSPGYCGIGDGQDYKEGSPCNGTIFRAKHCSTFHDLYSRLGVPMKHMGRIGRVYSDIKIYYQNGVAIDLAGDRTVVSQDAPRVRLRYPGQ